MAKSSCRTWEDKLIRWLLESDDAALEGDALFGVASSNEAPPAPAALEDRLKRRVEDHIGGGKRAVVEEY